jgi:hypothetical protein
LGKSNGLSSGLLVKNVAKFPGVAAKEKRQEFGERQWCV